MAVFKVTSPTGEVYSIEANSREESIVKAKQQSASVNPEASGSLEDKLSGLSNKVREASIAGERMGGSPIQSAIAKQVEPYTTGLEQSLMAAKAIHGARNQIVDYTEEKTKEANKMLEDVTPEIPIPLPTPMGIQSFPAKKVVSTAHNIVANFGTSMLDPYNLALTYAAPSLLKGGAKVVQGIKETPEFKQFATWAADSVPVEAKVSLDKFLAYVRSNLPAAYKQAKAELPFKQTEAAKSNIAGLEAMDTASLEQNKEITGLLEGKLKFPASEVSAPKPIEVPKIEAYVKGTMGGGISPNTGKPLPVVKIYGVKGDPEALAKNGWTDVGSVPETELKAKGIPLPEEKALSQEVGPEATALREKWVNAMQEQKQLTSKDLPDINAYRAPEYFKKGGAPEQHEIDRLIALPENTLPVHLTPEQITATQKAQQAYQSLGKEAVDLGLLNEDTYLRNLKTYNPRAYDKYTAELGVKDVFGGSKPERIQLDRFKKRTVTDPDSLDRIYGAFPTKKGLVELSAAVEKAKFFKGIAQNPEWASVEPIEGWKQLSGINGIGQLKGMYVKPEIAEDLHSTFKEVGKFKTAFRKVVSAWKLGKSTYNPAVQFNNALFNTVLADWSGADFATQAKLLPKVLDDIRGGKGIALELRKAGISDITEAQDELVKHLNKLSGKEKSSYHDIVAKALELPQKSYQLMETINKGVIYQAALDRGMPNAEAILHAKKWGMDYGDVSPLVRDVRQSIVPFVTFPTKLAPLAAEVVATNPMKVYKYKLFMDAVEQEAIDNGTVSPDDVQRIHRETKGIPIVLPFKSASGDPYVYNAARVLPIDNVTGVFRFGGPASIAAQTVFNTKGNTESGEPIPISPNTNSSLERTLAYTDFLGKTTLPSLTPGIPDIRAPFRGGTSFEKIANSIKGDRSKMTKQPLSTMEAVLSTLGIDVAADTSTMSRALRLEAVEKIIAEKEKLIDKTMEYKNLNRQEVEFMLQQFNDKLQDLLETPKSFREDTASITKTPKQRGLK